MEKNNKHCQSCDSWVKEVIYNEYTDSDQCKFCHEEYKHYSFQEHVKSKLILGDLFREIGESYNEKF